MEDDVPKEGKQIKVCFPDLLNSTREEKDVAIKIIDNYLHGQTEAEADTQL